MYKYLIILLLLFIGCESEDTTGSLYVITEIDTTVARIGDIINFNVIAQNARDKNISFPDMIGNESMEIRNKTIFSSKNDISQIRMQIVFWDTGSFTIPEYQIEILNADSTIDFSIKTDSIEIQIISMIGGSENNSIRPIKDPVEVKTPINWYRWLLAVLLLLLILLLIWLWKKMIKQDRVIQEEVIEHISAKDIALSQLDGLKDLINSDDKTFYLQASYILRQYIENQFYVRALEMTSNELKNYSNEFDISGNMLSELFNLFERADLAKFAKYHFSVAEKNNDYNWIRVFISSKSD